MICTTQCTFCMDWGCPRRTICRTAKGGLSQTCHCIFEINRGILQFRKTDMVVLRLTTNRFARRYYRHKACRHGSIPGYLPFFLSLHCDSQRHTINPPLIRFAASFSMGICVKSDFGPLSQTRKNQDRSGIDRVFVKTLNHLKWRVPVWLHGFRRLAQS